MKNQGILSFVIDKYQGDFRNGVCFNKRPNVLESVSIFFFFSDYLI